ncbi:cytochrome P450 family protein [Mycobacterium kansasii]|uniref:Cytochrome P450 family protein n=1 Tax=Mycobacterium kansasii TaxID=1768 RepID=A0A1V3WC32_MYCKA|nr:cytochrome P450 family protein [Mycobacterium kansasii]
MMLRSTYEDGSVMSRKDIGDELLTLLAAGHETTAATLAWAFERLTRHPQLLAALVAEADAGGDELRQATILEVQRARTVIDFAARHIYSDVYRLGEWAIPRGDSIIVNIGQIHDNPDVFPDPQRFDPQRYLASKPSAFAWIPFGGGTRRCVARRSPTWKWMWCCELCCATSSSRRRRHPTRSGAAAVSPTFPRTADGSWCAGADRFAYGSPMGLPTGLLTPGAAVSSPGGRSGRCTRRGSAAGNPGARARLPRMLRLG